MATNRARVKEQRTFPTSPSSLRWPSDEAFRNDVDPIHINPVSHVLHSWSVFSLASGLRIFFEAFTTFDQAMLRLRSATHADEDEWERLTEPMDRDLIILGNSGERMLLYLHRLCNQRAVQDFITAKHFIQHAAHRLHRKTTAGEIETLLDAADDFREVVLEWLAQSDEYVVERLEYLPLSLRGDFYIARDLYSVGLDEMALFSLGRGLELTCRTVLKERRVVLQRSRSQGPAHEARLYDIIETIGLLRWKSNGERLIPKSAQAMLHWLRDIRNEGAHGGVDSTHSDPYELGPIIARAADTIYRAHSSNRRRALESSLITLK